MINRVALMAHPKAAGDLAFACALSVGFVMPFWLSISFCLRFVSGFCDASLVIYLLFLSAQLAVGRVPSLFHQ